MMPKTVAAVAPASGAFGGTLGALVTAAAQSQASPTAIAAAAQRVPDASAERSLNAIKAEIGTAEATLSRMAGTLGAFGTPTVQSLRGTICQLEQETVTTPSTTFCPSGRSQTSEVRGRRGAVVATEAVCARARD